MIFQLYWLGDRDWVAEKLTHVVAGGFKAFCLTVDSAAYSRRERDLMLRAPGERRGGPMPAPALQDTQSSLSWPDVDWLLTQTPLPCGLKGILTAEDAHLAVDHGVDFIWVLTHGGRQLDGRGDDSNVLPEIVAAVRGAVPIVIDSGFLVGNRCDEGPGARGDAGRIRSATAVGSGNGRDGVHKVSSPNQELTINMKLAGGPGRARCRRR